MDFKELEKEIASRISEYLSDSNLSYDSLLYTFIDKDGWIPISVFILYKLKGLTTDEAEISKSIRKHCKNIEVSEDGKRIRRKKPIPNEFKDDSRTIYIEHIPNTISIEKIKSTFEEFGKIKALYFPDVKRRMNINDNNNTSNNNNNDDKKNNDFEDHKKEIPMKFFFITYKKKKSVELAMEKLNTWVQLTKHNFRDLINHENNGFRILPIKTWREMTKEYIEKRKIQIEKLKQNSQKQMNMINEIEYKPGLIAEFRGVHPETNRHILKKLFDLVSKTSFIDYSPNNTYGYIRYNDANSSKIAENYFSRKKVIQVNGLDVSGTLFSTLKKKFEEEGNIDLIHKYEIIRLRILEGDEEKEYWDYINGSLRNKKKKIDNVNNNNVNNEDNSNVENSHTVFDNENSDDDQMDLENEEKDNSDIKNKNDNNNTQSNHILKPKLLNEPLSEIKHIRFDDSEDEENEDEDDNKDEIENKIENEDEENTNENIGKVEKDNNNTVPEINNNKETASMKKKRKRKYLKKHLKQKEKKMKLKAENEANEANIINE